MVWPWDKSCFILHWLFPLQLDQGGLSLPSRDYYFHLRNSSNLMAYEDYAYSVAKKLGVPENRARREASDMVDFEIKLANVSPGNLVEMLLQNTY